MTANFYINKTVSELLFHEWYTHVAVLGVSKHGHVVVDLFISYIYPG